MERLSSKAFEHNCCWVFRIPSWERQTDANAVLRALCSALTRFILFKVALPYTTKAYGRLEVQLPSFKHQRGGEWSVSRLGHFVTHEIGSCVNAEPVKTIWSTEKSLVPANYQTTIQHLPKLATPGVVCIFTLTKPFQSFMLVARIAIPSVVIYLVLP